MAFLRSLAAVLLLAAVGCSTGCAPPAPDLSPPEGWQAEGDRWWRVGVDTTGRFRDLETLGAMGIERQVLTYAADGRSAAGVGHRQVVRAVKQSLIRLYRNEPEVVDSLFEHVVAPKIALADFTGPLQPEVEALKRKGYKMLGSLFKEPRAALRLGTDVPVSYPDSLRALGVAGSVKMQVQLDAEGLPQTVQLLEGIHPVLDHIALTATTQMRWRPAYLMRKGNWKPIPAWVRFNVRFATGTR